MDVSKLTLKGEWLEVEAESEKIGVLRFLIKPLSTSEQIDLAEVGMKSNKDFLAKVEDIVIGWNLTEGKEEVPCTKENKRKYMPYLITIKVKRDEKGDQEDQEDQEEKKEIEPPPILGVEIIAFAQNIENFVKN